MSKRAWKREVERELKRKYPFEIGVRKFLWINFSSWAKDHFWTLIVGVLVIAMLGTVVTRTLRYDSDSSQMTGQRGQSSGQAQDSNIPLQCIDIEPLEKFAKCVAEDARSDEEQSRDQSDLNAQKDMARWGFGVFWTGIMSAIISGVGVWALVWTFREQRKFTENQSRAYIEVIRSEIDQHPTYGMTYRIWLKNNGQTPARNIRLRAIYNGIPSQPAEDPNAVNVEYLILAEMEELPAKAEDACSCTITDELDGLRFLEEREDAGSWAWTIGVPITDGTFDPGCIEVNGRIDYIDAFDRPHGLNIHQFQYLKSGNKTTLRGTGRDSSRAIGEGR